MENLRDEDSFSLSFDEDDVTRLVMAFNLFMFVLKDASDDDRDFLSFDKNNTRNSTSDAETDEGIIFLRETRVEFQGLLLSLTNTQ